MVAVQGGTTPTKVAYLSYDGALDPLGSSQVVPYVEGLSRRGFRFVLVTFEKPAHLNDAERLAAMSARLAKAEIVWRPLRYHKSPRVPATLFDVVVGALCLRRFNQASRFDIFHCRGDITPVMVRLSRLTAPLLLDMRGFFSDERVDAASWAAGSALDKAVRVAERQNVRRAARIVVLTERGREILRGRGVHLPIDVIPTSVDCEHFKGPNPGGPATFDLVYFGSLGGWYMTEAMLEFVAEIRRSGSPIRVLFLTNNLDAATESRLSQAGITVRTASPADVPDWLSKCRASFFFIRATPSKIASCPTKLAEALAMGLPILTGPGVGDVDKILQEGRVGVVLDDFSGSSFREAWKGMNELLADPTTPVRCRSFAEHRLSLGIAIDSYERAYRAITVRP